MLMASSRVMLMLIMSLGSAIDAARDGDDACCRYLKQHRISPQSRDDEQLVPPTSIRQRPHGDNTCCRYLVENLMFQQARDSPERDLPLTPGNSRPYSMQRPHVAPNRPFPTALMPLNIHYRGVEYPIQVPVYALVGDLITVCHGISTINQAGEWYCFHQGYEVDLLKPRAILKDCGIRSGSTLYVKGAYTCGCAYSDNPEHTCYAGCDYYGCTGSCGRSATCRYRGPGGDPGHMCDPVCAQNESM